MHLVWLNMNFSHYSENYTESSQTVFSSSITNVSFSVLNRILVKGIWIMILYMLNFEKGDVTFT